MHTMLKISVAALISMQLAGCGGRWGATSASGGRGSPATTSAQGPSTFTVVAQAGTSIAGQARSISTQLANYTLVRFESLPGWQNDDFSQGWSAFMKSCRTLGKRGDPWRQICDRARQVDAKSDLSVRSFFEREFSPYLISDDSRRLDAVVTGYFESETLGSRTYQPPFIYPVYGEPKDMLYLDARTLPAGGGSVAARVQNKQVLIQRDLNTRDLGEQGLYVLDTSLIKGNTTDRKLRLRIEGLKLLPYYSREEIDTRGAPDAPVLAFLSSAAELYDMQTQRSGRIRLTDGSVIKLDYAEQNGLSSRSGKKARRRRAAPPSGPVLVPGQSVQGVTGSGIQDPNYVFFKEVGGGGAATMGAVGVALTPGRSIAVDPRTMPLGYPVFISTRIPDSSAPVQRLMVAQDSRASIRGAAQVAYFFGSGKQAQQQAQRMKEDGKLWILLPRGQAVAIPVPARARKGASASTLPLCLAPQDDACDD
jgi:membrane-bound lytic murein transglycosylase A